MLAKEAINIFMKAIVTETTLKLHLMTLITFTYRLLNSGKSLDYQYRVHRIQIITLNIEQLLCTEYKTVDNYISRLNNI